MTVFLRWGAFALLAIAALVYAYRVNEQAPAIADRMANANTEAADSDEPPIDVVADDALPKVCAGIITAMRGARTAAENGDPLDRALRQSVIAFETDPPTQEAMRSAAEAEFVATRDGESRSNEIAASTCMRLRRTLESRAEAASANPAAAEPPQPAASGTDPP